MDRLKEKIALVTGSSRGIGAAIATLFAREGAKVALHGRDVDALSAVLADIAQAGGQAIDVTADVTKFGEIEAIALPDRTGIRADRHPRCQCRRQLHHPRAP
jgi:3-oxoacyl-[acyl-carrier protein] reductase